MSITEVWVVVWQATSINGIASGASFLHTGLELRHGPDRSPVLAGLDRPALPKERQQAVENAGCGGEGFQDR
ncbi:MAG TPA: hypothetical protein VH858_06105 [Hyphomicrobiales bacterium]